MKTKTKIIIITLLFIAHAIPAGAQMYERSMAEDVRPFKAKRRVALARIQEIRANLTIEQRDAIRKLRDVFLDETVELRKNIREKGAEFRHATGYTILFLWQEQPGVGCNPGVRFLAA